MIIDLSNPIGIGPLWSVVAVPSQVVVVAGPWCVEAINVYVPGIESANIYRPGAEKQRVYLPGPERQTVCK